jgi:peroxiredoxin
MSRSYFIFSLIFSAAALTLVYGGQLTAGQAAGALAWTFGLFAMKSVTRGIDKFTWIISTGVLFFCIDPAHYGFPWFLLCGFSMFFVYLPRIVFLQQIGFLKHVWMDVSFGIACVVFYVTGNLLTPVGWAGWAFLAFPVLYTGFKTIGVFLDYRSIKALSGRSYKAAIDSEAPDFTLESQDGTMVKLSDHRGKSCVLLIFVRGDWCPTCHITLRSYEKNRQKFQDGNVTVMSIGPDPVGVNREMVKKLGVNFHILADAKGLAAKAYGIQSQENNPMTKFEEGIPLPASFLICPKGIVRFTSRADRPGEVFNPEDIFPILQKIAS